MSSEVQGPGAAQADIASGQLSTVSLVSRPSGFGGARRAIVKRLRPELAGREDLAQLLVDERRFAAAIHHANVASLYADGSDGSEPCFEYVDGESLELLLLRSERTFKARFMVPVFVDVLRGLGAIHAARDAQGTPLWLVHQAPHAHHIMVGTDGASRLIDLSQARVASSPYVDARESRLRPGHAAPEQVLDAGTVDHRADLFIVGLALWEALTGESLFFADDSVEASRLNVLHRSVPKPSSVGRKPPEAFDAVCLRALERDPGKRFQTAAEMQAALVEAGRTAGAATAFEVGQWVMAVAGAALRARHSIPAGAFGAGGSGRPDARFRTSPPPSGRPPSAFPGGQIRIARPSDSVRPPPVAERIATSPPPSAAASSAFGARGTGLLAAPAAESRTPSVSPQAAISPTPSAPPRKITRRMDASVVPPPPAAPAAAVTPVPPAPSPVPPPAVAVPVPLAEPGQTAPPVPAAASLAPTPQAFDAEAATSEMRRPISDAPTEILSAEQARELAVRTEALRGQTPTGPADDDAEWQSLATTRVDGAEPYVGRVTQELFPIRRTASTHPPVASKPPAATARSARPAPPTAPSATAASAPEATALAAPSEPSPTGPARRRPESTRPPIASEPVPRRTLRTPIVAPSAVEIDAASAGPAAVVVATGADAPWVRSAADAGTDGPLPAERADLAIGGDARSPAPSALVYVPRLDDDDAPSAAWGPDGAGAPTHSGGRDSITSRSPESGGSWATLAVVAAVAVVAVALVFGANRQVTPPEPSLSTGVPSVTPVLSPAPKVSPIIPTVNAAPALQVQVAAPMPEPQAGPALPDVQAVAEPAVRPAQPEPSAPKAPKASTASPVGRDGRASKEPAKATPSRPQEEPVPAPTASADSEEKTERGAVRSKPSTVAVDPDDSAPARPAAPAKPVAAEAPPPAEKLPINPY